MKRTFKFLTIGAATLWLAGCASRRLASQTGQPTYMPPPPPTAVYPGSPYPQPGVYPGALPANPYAAPPAPISPPPNSSAFPVAPPAPPGPSAPVAPPATSSAPNPAPDRVGYRWEATAPPPSSPQTAPPPPSTQAAPPDVLLLPPVPDQSAAAKPEPRKQLYPDATKEPPAAAPLPVGIAGFDRARDNIATGQRPSLEGLDWLQKSGYRTVVFLHQPGEMTDADRQQIEKRGMTFIALEINPRDLSRDVVDRFIKLQTDNRSEKIFVYDLDGSLAGAMWYLSFRMIDQDSDEIARVKAGSHGQGENRDAAREIWQAVRKYTDR